MRHALLTCAISGVVAILIGCSNERSDAVEPPQAGTMISREMLQAHGFKESKHSNGTFVAEHVRLAEIAKVLDFNRAALHPTVNQSADSDIRAGETRGVWVVVESEVKDANGRVIKGSLDQADPLCTVSVVLNPIREPTHKGTESTPSLRIVSAAAEFKDNRKALRVTFELSAVGKTPVAVSQSQFALELESGGAARRLTGKNLSFANGTPDVLTVSPGKPLAVTVTKSGPYVDDLNKPGELSTGRYRLSVSINPLSKLHRFDYHWVGYTASESREIVIQ